MKVKRLNKNILNPFLLNNASENCFSINNNGMNAIKRKNGTPYVGQEMVNNNPEMTANKIDFHIMEQR